MEQLPSETLLVTVAEVKKKEVTNHPPALKSSNGNKTWHHISLAKTRHVVMPNFKVGQGSVILPWKSMSQDYLVNHTSDHDSPKFGKAPCGKHHMLATLRCSCSRGQFFGIAPAQARSVLSLEALVKQTRACISQQQSFRTSQRQDSPHCSSQMYPYRTTTTPGIFVVFHVSLGGTAHRLSNHQKYIAHLMIKTSSLESHVKNFSKFRARNQHENSSYKIHSWYY